MVEVPKDSAASMGHSTNMAANRETLNGAVEVLSGADCMTEVVEVLGTNLEAARKQKERLATAEVVAFVEDCPDVRVDFSVSEEAQEILSRILGKRVAVVPKGSFGAGGDLDQLKRHKSDLVRDDQEVIVIQMPHLRKVVGGKYVRGCGAQGAYASGCEGLPEKTAELVNNSITDPTPEGHADGLFSKLEKSGLEGVTVSYAHEDRKVAGKLTRATKGENARKLAEFFSGDSDDLHRLEELIGMPEGIDTDHQHAPFAALEVGTELLSSGGAPVWLNGDRSKWGDPFVFTQLDEDEAAIELALSGQLYPPIAQHHGDFQGLKALVVFGKAVVKEKVAAMAKRIHTETGFAYPSVVFVDTGKLVEQLAA